MPDLVPKAVGVNVTEIVQLAAAAKVFGEIGHSELAVKSPAVVTLAIVSGVVWLFVNVIDLALLGVFNT